MKDKKTKEEIQKEKEFIEALILLAEEVFETDNDELAEDLDDR